MAELVKTKFRLPLRDPLHGTLFRDPSRRDEIGVVVIAGSGGGDQVANALARALAAEGFPSLGSVTSMCQAGRTICATSNSSTSSVRSMPCGLRGRQAEVSFSLVRRVERGRLAPRRGLPGSRPGRCWAGARRRRLRLLSARKLCMDTGRRTRCARGHSRRADRCAGDGCICRTRRDPAVVADGGQHRRCRRATVRAAFTSTIPRRHTRVVRCRLTRATCRCSCSSGSMALSVESLKNSATVSGTSIKPKRDAMRTAPSCSESVTNAIIGRLWLDERSRTW